MPIIPIFDYVNENIDYGVSTAGRIIVDAGRDVICSVRNQYPNSFSLLPFDKALGNGLCQEFRDDEPEETTPSFQGGQCVDSTYTVTFQFERYSNGNLAQTGERTVIRVKGAIRDVIGDKQPTGNPVAVARIITEPDRGFTAGQVTTLGGINDEIVVTGFQVEVEDGQPDNCGNPPSSLPPDPERNPDDFTTTVDICRYDENGDVIDCEAVTVELPQEDFYKFPICIVVDGRKICYDVDGWNVEDVVEEEEEEEKEEEEEIEVLEAITITVNQPPLKFNKRITRKNGKDTEIFAGYLAWSKIVEGEEFFFPAIPIRKEKNYFIPPEGIENYSVYYNFELTGTVREIKKTIKVPKQTSSEDDTI